MNDRKAFVAAKVLAETKREVNASIGERHSDAESCAICGGCGWYMRELPGKRHPNRCPNGCAPETELPAPSGPVRMSDDLAPGHWMARQLPSGTSLRGYAEDEAVANLTGAVQAAINAAGLTRSEVAALLGTTKSYVSQVLNGHTNMTLKTLGALLWAAGQRVDGLRVGPLGGQDPDSTSVVLAVDHAWSIPAANAVSTEAHP